MTACAVASAHLAVGLSDAVPKSAGKILLALEVWIPFGLTLLWALRRHRKGWQTAVFRRARASANFRARWPADRMWQIPYAELEAEINSCWQLVIVLESQNALRKGGATAEECERQIVALRDWVSKLLGPFNAAAVRERRTLG